MLTLRPTGLSPPVYRDQLDYEVIEGGRAIGRMYEDPHALPELRWFWSITVFVGYRPGLQRAVGRQPYRKPRRGFWRTGRSAAPTRLAPARLLFSRALCRCVRVPCRRAYCAVDFRRDELQTPRTGASSRPRVLRSRACTGAG
jgi:hypothetical protein